MSTSDKPNFRNHTLAENPDLTPEEMGRRFLKLIDSIHSFNDLTLDHVQKIMRQSMYRTTASSHGFGMHLPESGWYYGFDYYDNPKSPDLKNVSYRVDNDTESADMGPVCGMDFDAYEAALKAMGFKERPDLAQYDTGEDGRIVRQRPGIGYTRKDVKIIIIPRVQADSPEAKLNHMCVEYVGVSWGG